MVAFGAMFDVTIPGGSFASNTKPMPILHQFKLGWEKEKQVVDTIVDGAGRLGIRLLTVDAIAMTLLVLQDLAYGYNVIPSSAVSYDEELAKVLYDWTDGELVSKGY